MILTSLLRVSTTAYVVFSTPTPGIHRPPQVLMKSKHSDCAHTFHICHAAIIYVMKAKQSQQSRAAIIYVLVIWHPIQALISELCVLLCSSMYCHNGI
jgi:hypothetical protein